jgi:hydroxypyruvate reductase
MPAGASAIRGSHPFPDANSQVAALQAIEALKGLGKRDLVLFLISGGSSAMIELPLNERFSTDLVADFHRALVHSGLGIKAMNTLRKHFSAVKGGRLAFIAGRAQKHTLLVSDVPDGQWDVIGSGPSLPDSSTREDCWRILRENAVILRLPESVSSWFWDKGLPETPKEAEVCFENARVNCLMSTGTMVDLAAALLGEKGWEAVIDNTCDDWDYRAAGDYLMDRLEREVRDRGRACLVSGGEVLVSLGTEHGIGGRNQQFALYCAARLPQGMAATIISVGSDGVDGNSPAAGAIVDGTTIKRAQQRGLSAASALRQFDTYPFFRGLGDDVTVRPTGNNVRDLRILLGERA